MRVYDIQCNSCGTIDEVFVATGSSANRACPYCNTGTQLRLLSAPRFELEGITGDFPGAANKWADKHVKGAAVSHKRNFDRKVHEVNIGEREHTNA
jgi:putative FmdB family regulatory protein